MDVHYFDSQSGPLLGVHHPASPHADSKRAVVLCSPLWQEYNRTHWQLKLLAKQLARRGVHVLRFDYRGHGDSHGSVTDVNSLGDWIGDIDQAIDRLKSIAEVPAVALLGLRAGANLAAEAASKRDDVHGLVLWEPLASGEAYLRDLRQMHSTMLDLWWDPVQTVNDETYEELLGSVLSRSLITQLAGWVPNWEEIEIPQVLLVHPNNTENDSENLESWQKRVWVTGDSDWSRLSEIETAWLRPKQASEVGGWVTELFDRLESRQMLEGKTSVGRAEVVS